MVGGPRLCVHLSLEALLAPCEQSTLLCALGIQLLDASFLWRCTCGTDRFRRPEAVASTLTWLSSARTWERPRQEIGHLPSPPMLSRV